MILWGVVFFGCGVDIGEIAPKGAERVHRDGRIYILNNIRPNGILANGETDPRIFFIVYEGQEYLIPHNMTYDGQPTLVGAVSITPEPLPGGTQVDFDYVIEETGDKTPRKLSTALGDVVTIDGDITIEFYDSDWEIAGFYTFEQPVPRILAGKFDSIHDYRR